MKRRNVLALIPRRHGAVWLGLAILTVLIAWHTTASYTLTGAGPLPRLDTLVYDWRFQLLPPRRAAILPIVVVDVDEFTQQREGRWPWDRAKVAQLVTTLRQLGAALVGFDVVFSEQGPNPAQQLLDATDWPPDMDLALNKALQAFDGDAALAEAMGNNTFLGYFLHAGGVRAGVLPLPFLKLAPGTERSTTLISMPDYTGNLAALSRHAAGSGFITAVPDADGIVRRMPLVMRHADGVYASLTLELARVALGAKWIRLTLVQNASAAVVTGVQIGRSVSVPLDAQGNLLVPYRGAAGAYPYISATTLLRGDASPAEKKQLDGALVLVGTSALGLGDLRTIPLQTAYPGVEVHANVLDTILQAAMGHDTLYTRPDWAPGATFTLILLSGILLALVLPRLAPLAMLAVSAGWLALVVSVNFALWQFAHLALPVAIQVIVVVVLAGMNIAIGYLRTSRQKHAIQAMFGQYVPPAYVDRMIARPDDISWSGEQREMTVLFADVRNFTTLSESLPAPALKDLLNRYLTDITRVIFDHHGTIDKYVGDMVMAFWNAPLDDPRHAHHAVAAALDMQRRMVALRQEFVRDGLPAFDIGIGVATGLMTVGDMGSIYRRAYTVLGDTVNLGSRLESLTTFYGASILVDPSTRNQAGDFLYRSVDRVRVKGRREPVDLNEPVCLAADADAVLRDQISRFTTVLECYRDRHWPKAGRLLQALIDDDPDQRKLYALYRERMAQTKPYALAPDWAGIYDHENK